MWYFWNSVTQLLHVNVVADFTERLGTSVPIPSHLPFSPTASLPPALLCPVLRSVHNSDHLWGALLLDLCPILTAQDLMLDQGVVHDSGRVEQVNSSHITWSFSPWPLSLTLIFFHSIFKSFMGGKKKEKPCIPIFQTTQSSIFSPNWAHLYMIYPKACQGSCIGC